MSSRSLIASSSNAYDEMSLKQSLTVFGPFTNVNDFGILPLSNHSEYIVILPFTSIGRAFSTFRFPEFVTSILFSLNL